MPTNITDDIPAATTVRPAWRGHAWALGGIAATTLLANPHSPWLDPVNVAMLYLLGVVVVAYLFTRGAAITSAVLGVAAFDFFFVPPQFSLTVADSQYLVTFGVMLATGLVIAQLSERLRHEATRAWQRERRSRELYELARSLSAVLDRDGIADAVSRCINQSFGSRAVVVPAGDDGALQRAAIDPDEDTRVDMLVARAVFAGGRESGLPGAPVETDGLLYLALAAPHQVRGVLVVRASEALSSAHPEARLHLQTCAVLIATALERMHFVSLAREATVHMEGERLRSTLLSALSHDLRTPLTAILGSADSMRLRIAQLPADHAALIDAIREQAWRTSQLVENILDMARLESGVTLRREWYAIDEIVGSALAARESLLAGHVVGVSLAPDLPLVECDATLMERVLVNLLENAAKYTPPGSHIDIHAAVAGSTLRVSVADNGPGIDTARRARIFDKFERAGAANQAAGLGLGLAICRAVIDVHGGTITVDAAPHGGTVFTFSLPLGSPPDMNEESMPA